MEWTSEHIAELEQMALREKRGGYEQLDVDLLIRHTVAHMRAGRQIPDPSTFALPTTRFGHGYARADVQRLLDRLTSLRSAWTPTTGASSDPAPADQLGQHAPTTWRWTQAQIDWVRDTKFAEARGGYEQSDVDDFLDQVIVVMAHGKRLPDIVSIKFDTSGFRTGYTYSDVDSFLDELAKLQPSRD